ncbi:MAG: hypothetical protein HP000_02830 [Odoribacter sp.]|nr:hypothetical protein [Odoribacter sp.]
MKLITNLVFVIACLVFGFSEYAVIIHSWIIDTPNWVYHLVICLSLIYIIWNIRRYRRNLSELFRRGYRKFLEICSRVLNIWITKFVAWNNKIKRSGNKGEFHQQYLIPAEEDDGVYSQLLWEAVCDKDVQNIAITGPYGSGKSSVIKAFQKEHPEYKYLNLSLANFQEQAGQEQKPEGTSACNDKKLSPEENQLVELSILQQMFYQVKRKRIPDSRFKRINRLSKWACLCYTFLIFLWVLALSLVFKVEWDNISPYVWLQSYKAIYVPALLYFILGIIMALKYLVRLVNRSHFKALKVEKCGMEISGDNEVSILNKHLDEILYYFEVTKFNIVIIEDLDRFERCSIFTKLRELNALINKSEDIHRRVVFIYAIKDDMFKDKERTKFFDYILPVIPYINKSNSAGKFIQLFEKAGFLGEVEKTFLEEIAIFIDDMRLLNNVFNEYEVYRNKLSGVINYNKLLAIVVYKNTNPKNFSDLHFGKGIINQIFDRKEEIIERKKGEIQKKIDVLQEQLEQAKKENLVDERELRMLVLGRLKMKSPQVNQFYNGNGYIGLDQLLEEKTFEALIKDELKKYVGSNSSYLQSYTTSFSELEKEISPDFNYKKRLANIQNRLKNNSNQIKSQIEKYTQEIRSLSKWTYAQLVKVTGFDETVVKLGENGHLLRFLLINGYIDEDYYYYISFFHQGDITPEDRKFIEVLKSGGWKPYTYRLSQIESIVKQLRLSDFDKGGIINLDLLEFLLGNEQNYPDQTDLFLKQLRSKEQLPFINDFVDRGVHADRLMIWLCQNWDEFWKYLLSDGNLSEEKEKQYWVTVFNLVDEENIIRQNAGEEMTDYINQLTDFFELTTKINDQDKLCNLLNSWNILIERIDRPVDGKVYKCLLKGRYYVINFHNISTILLFEIPNLTEDDLKKRNYSTIINSGCTDLISYINAEINLYVEKVNLGLDECDQENVEAFVLLLNNEALKKENKHLLIERNHCVIKDFDEIEDKTLWTLLLKKELIKIKWDNVFTYWEQNGFDVSLWEFLNKKWVMDILIETDADNLSEEFVVELLGSDKITYHAFKTYLDSECPEYIPTEITEMSEDKVLYLIENHKFDLDAENYDILKDSFPEMSFALIKNNLEEYIAEYNKYSLSDTDAIKVLKSDCIESVDKIKIIVIHDLQQVENNLNLCRAVAAILAECGEWDEIGDNLIEIILQKEIPVKDKVMIVARWIEKNDITDEKLEKYLSTLDKPYSLLCKLRKTVELDDLPCNRKLIDCLSEERIVREYMVTDGRLKIETRWNK